MFQKIVSDKDTFDALQNLGIIDNLLEKEGFIEAEYNGVVVGNIENVAQYIEEKNKSNEDTKQLELRKTESWVKRHEDESGKGTNKDNYKG